MTRKTNEFMEHEPFDMKNFMMVAPISSLMVYHSCENGHLFKRLNESLRRCPFCGGKVKYLSEDQWYNMVEERLEEDEIEDMEKQRKLENETVIDIRSLGNIKKRRNID